ncbi:M48 family metallopeptidase [Paraclostridium sordellii]|uniref:M48 family metallopeptidase n=1 Tax=Paraclostridium sordellii TaxID=1505 RepID=UPI00189B8606|nr:SprT family zinc-dependent metalloprotease [Paeniclostridium sordellii]
MELGFQYGTRYISFNLIYRKRKNMSIEIGPSGEITVISPLGVDYDTVIEKVRSKGSWIIGKLYEVSYINDKKIHREAVSGESFMYLGRSYSLDLVLDESVSDISVKLFRGKFMVMTNTLDEDSIKKALEFWYREKTLSKILERVEYYQLYFRDKVSDVKVKDQKKRWASCTSDNRLLFNWRCVMAPSNILDYIVVHEMCHMEHKDHSKVFWDRLCSVMPDYESRRQWLKNNGIKLDL